jgi:sugar phosphate isomerase/epimerase
MQQDFDGVVRRIADMGYAGVEPFGAPDNLAEAAALYKTLGLAVPSAHVPMPVGKDEAIVLNIAEAYGLERIISGYGPDNFKTLDDIKRTCDVFNQAAKTAAENGLVFGIHNHWWEYLQVDGRYVYHIMQELIDPSIFFQIDVYWVQVAGVDPAAVVAELSERVLMLHIKDGPAVQEEPMTAVGDGVVDISGVVAAGAGNADWLVVELDRCATDVVEAVEKSYNYLVKEGLGHGRQG